jgi:hypothetical protein
MVSQSYRKPLEGSDTEDEAIAFLQYKSNHASCDTTINVMSSVGRADPQC